VKKITPPKSVTHPISAKIIAGLRKTNSRKVVDISELRDAKITAENLKKTVITEKSAYNTLYPPFPSSASSSVEPHDEGVKPPATRLEKFTGTTGVF